MGTPELYLHLIPFYFPIKYLLVRRFTSLQHRWIQKGLNVWGYIMIALVIWILYGLYTDLASLPMYL